MGALDGCSIISVMSLANEMLIVNLINIQLTVRLLFTPSSVVVVASLDCI